jgi:hypothetical protein
LKVEKDEERMKEKIEKESVELTFNIYKISLSPSWKKKIKWIRLNVMHLLAELCHRDISYSTRVWLTGVCAGLSLELASVGQRISLLVAGTAVFCE